MYWQIFWSFFKIGAFTIGGGYAMIPLMEREVVNKRRWMEKMQFIDLVGIAQSAPGVFAVNMSVFTGYHLRGVKGSLAAAIAAVLPSFVIMLCIAMGVTHWKNNVWVMQILMGIRPVVVALIASTVFSVARTANVTFRTAIIPLAVALLVWSMEISPACIVLAAAAGGIAAGKWKSVH